MQKRERKGEEGCRAPKAAGARRVGALCARSWRGSARLSRGIRRADANFAKHRDAGSARPRTKSGAVHGGRTGARIGSAPHGEMSCLGDVGAELKEL